MITEAGNLIKQSIMITGFVFVMMLVIEYINVQTKGLWQTRFLGNDWKQYFLAAMLGVIPGCLGAFTAVSLYSHRLISFGAIVTAMIATSGDEAFVMLAMFPQKALLLMAVIFGISIIAGYAADRIPYKDKFLSRFSESNFPLHDEEQCKCFQKDKFLSNIIKPSYYRVALSILILSLIVAIATGVLAGKAEIWLKITLLLAILFSLFIVISVPEHFLKEHLWDHIVKIHIPRIFIWTFGTLLAIHLLMYFIDIQSWFTDNMLIMLLIAIFIGIIPESGPHLVFVTLYAGGMVPFSILLASSISQDGHGSLPLLAESKKGFLTVKSVNMVFALLAGLTGYLLKF